MSDYALKTGAKGFLISQGNRIPIEVADYCGKAIHVVFPEGGMVGGTPWCMLEVEDEFGAAKYNAQVCAATYDVEDGMVLVRVPGIDRNGVREFARVPAQMTIALESPLGAHQDATLINVSSGGALIETDRDLPFNSEIVLHVDIPDSTAYKVIGQVVHVEPVLEDTPRRYGVRFVEVQRDFLRSLFGFIWKRLKQLFPMDGATASS